jgi:glycosyltransferase involved in cell wall biosynthesis
MRILLLSHIFPPAIDGGSKVVYKLGQYFESQNFETLYLSSDCSSTDDFIKSKYTKSKKLTSNQIKIPVYHHLRRSLKLLNLFLHQDLLNVLQKGPIFKLIPFIKSTYKILKFKPDLIVTGPLPTTIILYANFFKKITKAKLLINASFHPTDPDFLQKPLINSLKQADFVWTLTQSETNYFINNFNINPSKLILAGNGVDKNFLIPRLVKEGTRGRFNILFLGSLAAHKRVDLLIKSFSSLISSQISLTIAGQKTLFYPQIEKLVKSLPKTTQKQIKFIFNFPQKDLAKLIDQCDVLVLPSIQESFGLVLIESWARSKPVITSDILALKELILKTKGGLVFKKDDQLDLQNQIIKLINNPKLCHQLGQNGFKYVKTNYTWEKVGQKICQKIL